MLPEKKIGQTKQASLTDCETLPSRLAGDWQHRTRTDYSDERNCWKGIISENVNTENVWHIYKIVEFPF